MCNHSVGQLYFNQNGFYAHRFTVGYNLVA